MKSFTAWRIEDSKAMALGIDCCIEVEVLQCAEGLYVVMDESYKRLYKTTAKSHEEAVRCYIGWCYGMTRLWKYDEAEDWDNALELAAEAIVDELPGWTVVPIGLVMERKYSPKDYEVVALRFCDCDFHFWKLGRNWNWYDKMGSAGWINRHAFNDVRYTWCYRYHSPIVCFIKAR